MFNITNALYLLKFIFLGFVQGFTEPIPVSSSGHVVIIKDVFGIITPGLSFEIIVNFGSLLAVVMVYRKNIYTLLKETSAYLVKRDAKYVESFTYSCMLFVSTLLTGVIGLVVEPFISKQLTTPFFVGVALLVTALFIWIIHDLYGNKQDDAITWKDACIIGLAQSLALIPGISRSGATVVCAMLLGLKRDTALRYSFLLYIPVSAGITLLSFRDIVQDPTFMPNLIPYIVAFLTAMVTTYYALRWFIHVMQKGKLIIFTYYCLIVGTAVIIHQLIMN